MHDDVVWLALFGEELPTAVATAVQQSLRKVCQLRWCDEVEIMRVSLADMISKWYST